MSRWFDSGLAADTGWICKIDNINLGNYYDTLSNTVRTPRYAFDITATGLTAPTQAVPAEVNPRNVLYRLFNKQEQSGGVERESSPMNALDRSLLDIVLGGARELRGTLPSSDQQKLDEYLDSVRSVERRIAAIEYRQKEGALEKAGLGSGKRRASDSPAIEIRIPEGEKRSEYMQVMCDLNILAFQTDTTRVSTYIGSTPNGASYPELGFNDQHHSQTHHNNEPEKVRKVAAIAEFNIAQFAYMVKKMPMLRGMFSNQLIADRVLPSPGRIGSRKM